MLNGKTYLRMNYDRTPYPPPADVVRNLNLVPLFAAAQPQQAISAPAQIDLSNEWPTTRYFVKQVMARFGIGPNENIASALRKLYAEAPAQPQQASPNSSST